MSYVPDKFVIYFSLVTILISWDKLILLLNIRKDTLVPNCRITYPEKRDLQAILLIANKKVWIIKFF